MDAAFFRDVLPSHIRQKAKDSAEGVVTVEIHLHVVGGLYTVASILDATDSARIIKVYPERGPARRTPAAERKLGAPMAIWIESHWRTPASVESSSQRAGRGRISVFAPERCSDGEQSEDGCNRCTGFSSRTQSTLRDAML